MGLDYEPKLTEQYAEGEVCTREIRDADSVRLWDLDLCVVEFTRHRNGYWVVTGSDVNAYDATSLKGYRNPTDALAAARRWYLGK